MRFGLREGKANRKRSFLGDVSTHLAYFRDMVHGSAVYQFLCSYGNSEKKFENSLFYRAFRIKKASISIKLFKNAFARACEDSVICNGIEKLADRISSCSVRSYAVLMFYFGMYALLVRGIEATVNTSVPFLSQGVYSALMLVLFSLLLMPFKMTFSKLVLKSKILSLIFLKLFFFEKEKLENSTEFYPQHGVLILFGTLLGLSTIIFPIESILLFLIILFSLLSVLKIPENGLVAIILMLPYLPQSMLQRAVVTVFAAYLYKLLRGKRVFKLRFFDVIVAIAAVIVLAGGVAVLGGMASFSHSFSMFSMILLYFMFVNMTRNDRMTSRFNFAITVTILITSLMLLYEKLYALGHIAQIERQMRFSFNINPTSIFDNNIQAGEFVLLLAPFAFSAIIMSRARNKKFVSLLAAALCGVLLVLTASKGLVLSFAVCIFIYIASVTKHPLLVAACIVAVCVAVFFLLPGGADLNSLSLSDYRFSIYDAAFDVADDYTLSGIGSGHNLFSDVMTEYMHFGEQAVCQSSNLYLQLLVQYGVLALVFFALMILYFIRMLFSCVVSETNISLVSKLTVISALSATLSLLCRGFSDYVFFDYRIFTVFWVIVGISAAVARYNTDEAAVSEHHI